MPLAREQIEGMVSEIDIYRSAAVMIRQYGEDAALEAGLRADILLDKGDIDGQQCWLRIARAISQLQRTSRAANELLPIRWTGSAVI